MKKNLKAFTLAETLITLGIIGVIAVLTLPNVMTSYKNKVYVTGLQKIYNQFSDAALKFMNDNRTDSMAETSLNDNLINVGEFFRTYFKVVKDCGESSTDCMGASYRTTDKSKKYEPDFTGKYCVTFNTGAAACMSRMNEDGLHDHGYANVIVDVNGKQGPNILGRDLFGFEFYSDGKVSEGYDMLTKVHYCNEDINDHGYAAGCFSKIMSEGWKMDY